MTASYDIANHSGCDTLNEDESEDGWIVDWNQTFWLIRPENGTNWSRDDFKRHQKRGRNSAVPKRSNPVSGRNVSFERRDT